MVIFACQGGDVTMKRQRQFTNAIAVSSLAVGIVLIIVTFSLGMKQNVQFLKNENRYSQAYKLFNEGSYEQAETLLSYLLSENPDNYTLNWDIAVSLSKQGRNNDAAKYFARAREIRPFLVLDPRFLYENGEVLLKVGDVEKAKRYLERAKQSTTDSNLLNQIDKLLGSITKS
jgi:predicted Zn-dependent protease